VYNKRSADCCISRNDINHNYAVIATAGRLVDVERQLAAQIEKNVSLVDELETFRVNKDELTRALQQEQDRTLELEADVAHLRADLEDVSELSGLETTNRLLREDLDRHSCFAQ